ncbi:unnamed protein product [Chrysodeixis includens]|uniref:Uncharacterized protein n=1 Tax=Chrysodeixis includens TaxID=689277 RepID=A0A9P0C558_CHRIL|nr:unnamed protein product [Chrysodeixis includens]
MDSEISLKKEDDIQMIFEVHEVESSIEIPMDQWSSLEIVIPEENQKKILFQQGLYSVGSGEICAKNIFMSDSDVMRHPYFNYPAIKDPGIEEALLQQKPPVVLDKDGQDLYLEVCKEMNICPVRSFWKGLKEEVIDLRYYCVNPRGVRAMALALQYNPIVKSLILIDNFLNDDACYHLSDMLLTNSTLTELNLHGCRIGPSGARRLFSGLHTNRGLIYLDIGSNQIGDDGMEFLADAVIYGLDVKEIDLSNNNISGKGVNLLAKAFETHNRFTHINLAWNHLYTLGTANFLNKVSESPGLKALDLSWTSLQGPRIGLALTNVAAHPHIKKLNLSNNKLEGEAIKSLISRLNKAKKMTTLDLSHNPMSPEDALCVLTKVRTGAVKVSNVFMDNIFVNKQFVALLETIKHLKSKKNLVVTYGGVIGDYVPKGPDLKQLILNRVEYITQKPKKNKVDFALIALQLQKDNYTKMNVKEFTAYVRDAGANLDDDLIDEMVNVFPGPKSKFRLIDINLLVDHCKRKWPDKKLPEVVEEEVVTEPEPPPPPPPKAKGKKK